MNRLSAVLCCAILAMSASAEAGRKCRQPPKPEPPLVFYADEADVHGNGIWHRTLKPGDPEKSGKLSPAALGRFTAFHASKATPAATIACLDALIANERDPSAARACDVPSPKK
jgi:hypothetical protein